MVITKTINDTLQLKNQLCAFDYVTGATDVLIALGIMEIEDAKRLIDAATEIDVTVSKKKKAEKEEMKAIAKAHREKQNKESKTAN